ncbi:hypothetical protein [uncultured Tateyamaria sp.]|nr:hypothetical protein [uncultured Tateyamaria sp.]
MHMVWEQVKGGQYPGVFWVTAVAAAAIGLATTALMQHGFVLFGLAVSLLAVPIIVTYVVATLTADISIAAKAARVLALFAVSMVLFVLLNGMRTA